MHGISLVGNKLSPTNWYTKSGNICSLVGALPMNWDFYDASGATIDPTLFVEMTTTTTTSP